MPRAAAVVVLVLVACGNQEPVSAPVREKRATSVPPRIEPRSEPVARRYVEQHLPPATADDGGVEIAMGRASYRLAFDESGEHARIDGATLPPGARLFPVVELPEIDLGVTATPWAIVSPDGQRAYLENGIVYPLERAAATGSDGPLTGARALAATEFLRYLRTCPVRRRECLVFGPAADVRAAVDPAAPPGGWFLDREPALTAGPTSSAPEPIESAPGLLSAPLPDAGGELPLERAFVRLEGRLLPAFDYPIAESPQGGLLRRGGRTIAWLRDVDSVRIRVAIFEPDGCRSAVLGASATTHDELFCGNEFTSTRPLPVLIDGRLAVALGWSAMREAILFDAPGRRGRLVSAVASQELGDGAETASDLAPIWTLGASGRLEPLDE